MHQEKNNESDLVKRKSISIVSNFEYESDLSDNYSNESITHL